jgi:hypothetical protein
LSIFGWDWVADPAVATFAGVVSKLVDFCSFISDCGADISNAFNIFLDKN